ncbi:cellulase family glycosylhydrolase [Microbacterium sp. H1-D42]|uniref:cellulase family glycosylhydrolase n=1 Tax=Microbacterium sp. H1-D42 TaxID=2925844 RepID=UPI001F52B7D0|nr:cellulase family glycosylhydrolase [Microbacterium sp. H1-D42]UNK71347.1 cellulase family glycosylhydrolase [Microbacterium sp. H1-D42]
MPTVLNRVAAGLALATAAVLTFAPAASAAPAPAASGIHVAGKPDKPAKPGKPDKPGKPGKPAKPGKSDATVTTPDGRVFITDKQGRALQLRGYNAAKYVHDRLNPADIETMADQGFNFLRLVVQWQYFEPEQGQYDQSYFDYVDSVLDAADREGVHVMLDMHQDVYGPVFGASGAPEWATRTDGLPFEDDPANWFNNYFQPAVMRAFTHLYNDADLQRAQQDLWTEVAGAFNEHESLLGYDLFNEPFGEFIEEDGGDWVTASARIESTQISDMYDRLIPAIRSVDDDSWIFVEPTVLVGYGVPTQLRSFDDPRDGKARLGYAPHFYNTGVEEGGDWTQDDFVVNYEAAISAYPTANGMPMIVGEWGVPNSRTPGNAALVAAQVSAMERFASGWAIWYYCASDGGGYCAMNGDGGAAPGNEPAYGPYARAIEGVPGAEQFDAATGTYTVTFTAGAGQSEIWVPQSTYAKGAKVSITGGKAHYNAKKQLLHITAKPGAKVTLTLTR